MLCMSIEQDSGCHRVGVILPVIAGLSGLKLYASTESYLRFKMDLLINDSRKDSLLLSRCAYGNLS